MKLKITNSKLPLPSKLIENNTNIYDFVVFYIAAFKLFIHDFIKQYFEILKLFIE